MDELLWRISWSVAIRPDLPLIPGRAVFLQAPQGRSLTATVESNPCPLLSLSETLIEHLIESAKESSDSMLDTQGLAPFCADQLSPECSYADTLIDSVISHIR